MKGKLSRAKISSFESKAFINSCQSVIARCQPFIARSAWRRSALSISVASLLLNLWFSPVSCLICNQRGEMDARERADNLSKSLDEDESD